MNNNTVPPQNIDAEKAILGGILLDSEAIGRVVHLLSPPCFYVKANQHIYSACIALHAQGKPTDLMTVSAWLQDHNLLEKIGGITTLADLVERTVSAVNIDLYAELIKDKFIRRQMISAGHEITDLGFDTTRELEEVFDEAEQKLFRLTQEKTQQGLVSISETLVQTFNQIENLQQNINLPGIPCGFYDLDAYTSGFQRSDLIIIAGRPSMGKCLSFDSEIVLSDGSIKTIAEIYSDRDGEILTLGKNLKLKFTQPSDFIDDGIKPVFRVTTRLGRTVETTLSHPYLTINGWKPLSELKEGDAIAVPRKIEVFGEKEMSPEQIKLIAYFIGDGCLTTNCPSFTKGNPVLIEDFTEAISYFQGVKVRIKLNHSSDVPSLIVSGDGKFIKENRNLFAKRFKKIIRTIKLSDAKLSELLGVTPSAVCQWKSGKCVPNRETFNQICQILQVTEEELIPEGLLTISKRSKNPVTLWLEEIGLYGKTAHQKIIPSFIFKLKKPLMALFLNRLFSTDGWALVSKDGERRTYIGYCTVNYKLARQIQHLLLRFGIIAKVRSKKVKYKDTCKFAWHIDVTDAKSLKIFIEEIGMLGSQNEMEQIKEVLSTRKYHTNRDTIPIAIWEKLKTEKGGESWASLARRAGIQGSNNINVNKKSVPREKLFKLAYALENQELQELATSDIYWDDIVSIEYVGDKQVYDLTIPDTHNFIANDVCVHNTALSLNIAYNIAKTNLPIAIFSLEMSREQLTQRLLSSESQIESNRLRSGRISADEFEPLSIAVGQLSSLPIFIDDTANLTVSQMRSQVRKLQAENGELGLVLLDYLQLMEGGGDNRVQELSKITRSLKGLAREVNVPVIALSQLSRGVEQRTNKRPMLSDLRESGCLSGDTLIRLVDKDMDIPIKELEGSSNIVVWALNSSSMTLEKAKVSRAFCTGTKPVFLLETRSGRKIKATGNHKFFSLNGWQRLDQLTIQDFIAIPDNKCTIYWDKIIQITLQGVDQVFDLTVPHFHSFVANNIIVHNSIEQDADLVMMLYRDSYYNPDSVDRNIAEIIIAKHRNGPTGTIKLLFKPELTKFDNLARF